MASNTVVIRSSGLSGFSNYFNDKPGSLLEATNVVIDRDQIIEPRRGFAVYGRQFGTSNDRTKQLLTYKNRVFRHVLSELQWDNGEGLFTALTGSTVNEIEPGLRIKSIEQNGNLYFTTSQGIKKVSAKTTQDLSSAIIQDAGGVKALDLQAQVNYSNPGFLPGDSKVAYRLVWGLTDANENLILGAPSNRAVVENIGSSSGTVNLSFPIPSGVTTSYFYQIYRTRVALQTPDPIDPGEDMYLVLEDFPTSAQISAGIVTALNDITPEDIAVTGAPLYTNPNGGEGIAQANDRPPFAKDITAYKGFTFYANTSTVQRLTLSFLSVNDLVSNVSQVNITDGVATETYTFQGDNEEARFVFGGIKSNYHNASPGPAEYITLKSANNTRLWVFYFIDNPVNDLPPTVPGAILVPIDISSASSVAQIAQAFATEVDATLDFNVSGASSTITVSWANNGVVTSPSTNTIGAALTYTQLNVGTGEDAPNNKIFLPRVPTSTENGPTTSQQLEQIANSFVKVINEQSSLINAFYISGFNDIPGQLLLENRVITGAPFYIYANSAATGGEFNPTLPSSNIKTVISTNEVVQNRVYYSKFQQPEAVPLLNYFDIGPKDKAILRLLPLKESIFALKEDGVYRISGDSAPFFIAGFDFSAQILAADSAVVLNNQVYCLTTQGVVVITDGGVSIISRPIENRLKEITRPGYAFRTATFGVSYESDRSYHLWTVTDPNDTVATQCYRFNTFTQTWTRWDNAKTCGIVNFQDDKLYLGAGDINYVERERKTLTRTDYADREYELNILLNGVNGSVMQTGTLGESEKNDVVVQTQYLTMAQFNRLLKKLDSDNSIKAAALPGIPDYFDTLEFVQGQSPRNKIIGLASKLDLDPGVNQTNFLSAISNYTQNITTTTHTSTQVTINFASNSIANGRYVTISGSNSTPSLNGTYQVVASTPTSITINKAITVDATVGVIQTAVNDFRDVQRCHNIIVDKLNTDSQVFFTNYQLSTGSSEIESVILDTDNIQNTITLRDTSLPLMAGPFVLFKAFNTVVQYSPQFAGDPSILKHFREGTIMFENSNYTNAELSYSSDLSPHFEETPFLGQGNGDWGQFNWGQQNWGGVGAPIPFRTLIPRQKQRCRFLNVKFEHMVAREKFSIYGISLTYRPLSTRAYFG